MLRGRGGGWESRRRKETEKEKQRREREKGKKEERREGGGETKESEGVEESKKKGCGNSREEEREGGKRGRGNTLVAHSSPISEDIGQFEESSVDENGEWESVNEGWELDDGLTLLTHPAGVEACTQTHMQVAMVRIVKYVVVRPQFVALSQPSSLVQLG